MYRKRFHAITPTKVVEYLLLDREVPALGALLPDEERALAPRDHRRATWGTWSNGAERELGKLNSELSYADTREILGRGLHEYIDDLQARLNYVGQSVHDTFFALKPFDEETPIVSKSRPPISLRDR